MPKSPELLRLPHPDQPSRIVATSNGELIVSAGDAIHVWSTAAPSKTPEPRLTIRDMDPQTRQPILVLNVSPDGQHLCTGVADLTTKVYSLTSGQRLAQLTKPLGRKVNAADEIRFSADSRLLATPDGSKVVIHHTSNWTVAQTLAGHTSKVRAVAFVPGTSLLVSAAGKHAKLWDLQTAREVAALPAFKRQVSAICVSDDGKTLAIANETGEVTLWDLPACTLRFTYAEHDSEVFDLAISPDATLIASSEMDESLHLWRAADGKRVGKLDMCTEQTIAFSPNGKLMAATEDAETHILDTDTGKRLAKLGDGCDLAFLDNHRLATADGNDVVVWQVAK